VVVDWVDRLVSDYCGLDDRRVCVVEGLATLVNLFLSKSFIVILTGLQPGDCDGRKWLTVLTVCLSSSNSSKTVETVPRNHDQP
jgi:hypothetical protein